MSKFSGIVFPFFGLKDCPVKVMYHPHYIEIINSVGQLLMLDDKTIPYPTYLGRLLILEAQTEHRVVFDITAYGMENLITSKVKWGVDSRPKIFDLSMKEKFPLKCGKIDKIKNNLVWMKGISYPFRLREDLIEGLNKFLFVELVNIDSTWYLYNFTYEYNKKETITL